MSMLLIALFGWMVYDIIADRGALSAGLALGCCSMPAATWPTLPDPILWLAFFGALWFVCRSLVGLVVWSMVLIGRRRRRLELRAWNTPIRRPRYVQFIHLDDGY